MCSEWIAAAHRCNATPPLTPLPHLVYCIRCRTQPLPRLPLLLCRLPATRLHSPPPTIHLPPPAFCPAPAKMPTAAIALFTAGPAATGPAAAVPSACPATKVHPCWGLQLPFLLCNDLTALPPSLPSPYPTIAPSPLDCARHPRPLPPCRPLLNLITRLVLPIFPSDRTLFAPCPLSIRHLLHQLRYCSLCH